jgi:hypothetical protein
LFEGVDEPDEALVSGLLGSGGAELSEKVGVSLFPADEHVGGGPNEARYI